MLTILLFCHLLGVVMLFSGEALALAGHVRLDRATTVAEVRSALRDLPVVAPLMGIGAGLVILAGIALVYQGGFGWTTAWIDVSFVIAIILAVNGPLTNGKRSEAILALAKQSQDGPITLEIEAARADRFLGYSMFFSGMELVALLYIMTAKPDWVGCIVAVALAAAVAIVPTMRQSRRNPSSDALSAKS
jgi:hypothetical protein